MLNTGKKRDIIDQFYTIRAISSKCIEVLLKTLEITHKGKDIFVEPSAGDGSFSDYFMEQGYTIDSYDIDPKKDYIVEQDFLQLDTIKYISDKNTHNFANMTRVKYINWLIIN